MLLTLKAPFSNHQWPSLVAQEPGTRGLAHKNLPGRALPPACEPAGPSSPLPTGLRAFGQTLRACTARSGLGRHWWGFRRTPSQEQLCPHSAPAYLCTRLCADGLSPIAAQLLLVQWPAPLPASPPRTARCHASPDFQGHIYGSCPTLSCHSRLGFKFKNSIDR